MKRSFRMAFVALMFFTLATLAAVSPAGSYESWRSWMIASPSMADAKKHGDFLCSIKPVPDNFSWECHFVEVYECWMTGANEDRTLLFKLKIDGKSLEEYRIYELDGLKVKFLRDGWEPPPSSDSCIGYFGMPMFLIFNVPGWRETVHYVHLNLDHGNSLRLRVGMQKNDDGPVTMGDTVVTFDISNEEDGSKSTSLRSDPKFETAR